MLNTVYRIFNYFFNVRLEETERIFEGENFSVWIVPFGLWSIYLR